ncbi:hypothetical protein HaLaN_25662 [Haematococcus lacustris]|uniref:Uncharacterized protein n=1 Tax=Haematococcus lacustris TaxID=44745 RepID=A0A6A0A3Q9_HAELA|nr:hypothetical protein HaLaN_25662 [Haematococcus lacustris]
MGQDGGYGAAGTCAPIATKCAPGGQAAMMACEKKFEEEAMDTDRRIRAVEAEWAARVAEVEQQWGEWGRRSHGQPYRHTRTRPAHLFPFSSPSCHSRPHKHESTALAAVQALSCTMGSG